ncbi:carboxypeptidase-like regulatory domain-containing protein [Thiomonas arsenitoxydans]|nr:carboxypeptidase-like regulatory domain-containing protein [Thiomonas arsenitoxydans]
MTGLISLFVVVCDFVKSKRSSVAGVSCGGFGEMCQFLKRRKNWLFESWTISSTSPPSRRVGRFSSLKNIIGGGMKNVMWNYRHVAVLGLVALLAGCGGGGGGGTAPATCTADCVSGKVTNSSGGGVSDVYVTATNPATGQVCSTSPNKTTSDGSYVLSTTACGNNAVVITAPIGSDTVVNSWNPDQPSTGVNLNPGTTSSLAAFAGTWTASYSSSLPSGGDSGSCTVVVNQSGVIDATQNVNNCTSNLYGSFTLTGALNDQGQFMGNTSTGATYIGQFDATNKSANGTWQNSGNTDKGPWLASLP